MTILTLFFVFLQIVFGSKQFCVKPPGSTVDCSNPEMEQLSSLKDFIPVKNCEFFLANDENTFIDVTVDNFAVYGTRFVGVKTGFIRLIYPNLPPSLKVPTFIFENVVIQQIYPNPDVLSTSCFQMINCIKTQFIPYKDQPISVVSDIIVINKLYQTHEINFFSNYYIIQNVTAKDHKNPSEMHLYQLSETNKFDVFIQDFENHGIINFLNNQVIYTIGAASVSINFLQQIDFNLFLHNSQFSLISNIISSNFKSMSISVIADNSNITINDWKQQFGSSSIVSKNSMIIIDSERMPFTLEISNITTIKLLHKYTYVQIIHQFAEISIIPEFPNSTLEFSLLHVEYPISSSSLVNIRANDANIMGNLENINFIVQKSLTINPTHNVHIHKLTILEECLVSWKIDFENLSFLELDEIDLPHNKVISIVTIDPKTFQNRTFFTPKIGKTILLFSIAKKSTNPIIIEHPDDDMYPINTLIRQYYSQNNNRNDYGVIFTDSPIKFHPSCRYIHNMTDQPWFHQYVLNSSTILDHKFYTSSITQTLELNLLEATNYSLFDFESFFDFSVSSVIEAVSVLIFNNRTSENIKSISINANNIAFATENDQFASLSLDSLSISQITHFPETSSRKISFQFINKTTLTAEHLEFINYSKINNLNIMMSAHKSYIYLFKDKCQFSEKYNTPPVDLELSKIKNISLVFSKTTVLEVHVNEYIKSPVHVGNASIGDVLLIELHGKFDNFLSSSLFTFQPGFILYVSLESPYVPLDFNGVSKLVFYKLANLENLYVKEVTVSNDMEISAFSNVTFVNFNNITLNDAGNLVFTPVMRHHGFQFTADEVFVKENSSVSLNNCKVKKLMHISANSTVNLSNVDISQAIVKIDATLGTSGGTILYTNIPYRVHPPSTIEIICSLPTDFAHKKLSWDHVVVSNILGDSWNNIIKITPDASCANHKVTYTTTKMSGVLTVHFKISKKFSTLYIGLISAFIIIVISLAVVFALLCHMRRRNAHLESILDSHDLTASLDHSSDIF